MNLGVSRIYRAFYFLSLKVNSQSDFHCFHACLGISILELLVSLNILIAYGLISGSTMESNVGYPDFLPMVVGLAVVVLNSTYFLSGKRYKKIVEHGSNGNEHIEAILYVVVPFLLLLAMSFLSV